MKLVLILKLRLSLILSLKITLDVVTCATDFILIAETFTSKYCLISIFTIVNRSKNVLSNKIWGKTLTYWFYMILLNNFQACNFLIYQDDMGTNIYLLKQCKVTFTVTSNKCNVLIKSAKVRRKW